MALKELVSNVRSVPSKLISNKSGRSVEEMTAGFKLKTHTSMFQAAAAPMAGSTNLAGNSEMAPSTGNKVTDSS